MLDVIKYLSITIVQYHSALSDYWILNNAKENNYDNLDEKNEAVKIL